MLPNADDPKLMNRLTAAVTKDRQALQIYRQKRRDLLEEYVGTWYSEDGATNAVHINYIEMMVDVLGRGIIASSPRVSVTTERMDLTPAAYEIELGANKRIKQLSVVKAVSRAVTDALFSVGINKVGTELGAEVRINGVPRRTVQPWVDYVDLDDFVCDMTARNFDECTYMGNRFTIPFDVATGNQRYDQDVLARLRGGDNVQPIDADGNDRTQTLGVGADAYREPFAPLIDLWEMWLPLERVVVVYADGMSDKPLDIIDWKGPEHGPYHWLAMKTVPGQIMPLSPIAAIADLHMLLNTAVRKLREQIENQKTIGLVEDEGMAEQIRRFADGEIGAVNNPRDATQMSFNGPDPGIHALVAWLDGILLRAGGNLSLLGGFGPQSDTATQDKMLNDSASGKIAAMQDRTREHVRGIVKDLVYYDMQNPDLEIPVEKLVPDSDIRIPTKVTPARHFEEFMNFEFDIVPYSMQEMSPRERAGQLIEIMTKVAPQFMEIAARKGLFPDVQEFFLILSEHLNMPELKRVWRIDSPIGDAQGPESFKPANTTRTVERINRPGNTQQGKNAAMIQSLLGSGSQPNGAQFREVG